MLLSKTAKITRFDPVNATVSTSLCWGNHMMDLCRILRQRFRPLDFYAWGPRLGPTPILHPPGHLQKCLHVHHLLTTVFRKAVGMRPKMRIRDCGRERSNIFPVTHQIYFIVSCSTFITKTTDFFYKSPPNF